MTAIVVGYLTRADLAPSVAEHHRPSRRTVEGPCDVPPDEASCFWDYFQQSKSPIGIPVAGSPDWDHPVCGPPHP